MSDLDTLIATFVSDAQIESGAPMQWMVANGLVARAAEKGLRKAQPRWTEEEEQFYVDHLTDMTLEEIAAALGRSVNAVKCHRFKAGLPSHRVTPGYLSTNQVAGILGVDSHYPPIWVDYGILPGQLKPYENDKTRQLSWMQFKLWLIRPTSWIYFKVERMKHPGLKRLVELAQERWGDAWWTTRQAADYLGCEATEVENQIQRGRIYGIQAWGGRNPNARWAYYYVRRSEAMKLVIPRRGESRSGYWSPRADAFIIRARAEGMMWTEMAPRMKWPLKRLLYRVSLLRKKGLLPAARKWEEQ